MRRFGPIVYCVLIPGAKRSVRAKVTYTDAGGKARALGESEVAIGSAKLRLRAWTGGGREKQGMSLAADRPPQPKEN